MSDVPGGPGETQPAGSGPLQRVRFSDRSGGVSSGPFESLNLADHVGDRPESVVANRDRLAARVGLSGSDLAIMKAAHGKDSALVAQPGTVDYVDILVTTNPDLGLVALAADCVPIALVDERAGVAAAVHSGWRGVAVDAAGAAVAAMVSAGADPTAISAHLGAAICAACYEVSQEVQDEVVSAASAASAVSAEGRPSVDLHAAVLQQLARAGVANVTSDATCTAEAPDLFSYRRDGVTGRQGVVVRLPGSP